MHNRLFALIMTIAFSMLLAPTCEAQQYAEGNTHAWGNIQYKGRPWVKNTSRPHTVTRGLQGRHISLWASHGRYWDATRGWQWQRPLLFGTTEDLFTQTIVVPFLMPMLENAGAIVFSPRERDWQKHEVIVDGDTPLSGYHESNGKQQWQQCDSLGFAIPTALLHDGDNPFLMGHVRQAKATHSSDKVSHIEYRPQIPEDGRYAVYVSYASLPQSVDDARYTIVHKGIRTECRVNQRMGGGTWVYLGTFDFDKGESEGNQVELTNLSSGRGIVTADAVRFGGGMGNIERGGSTSHLPRCLEGARYWAQWAGMPRSIYGARMGKNDYADDINSRSLMTNHLAGSSVYMPLHEGLGVPIELALAIHSDAGYQKNGRDIYGTLAVCTSEINDEELSSGISRLTSRDLAQALLDNFYTDLNNRFGRWAKREVWDKNYSETRLPEVPSAILETLSHQNFPDMRMAQDPLCKFVMARSIYKTLLRYICTNHSQPYTVQPLPPHAFEVTLSQGKAVLKWQEQKDDSEPSARATSYNVYIAEGDAGFSNGTNVKTPSASIPLKAGTQYSFYVTAVNDGGESMPSETLSAYLKSAESATALVVNNFHRLAAPQVVDNDSLQGFDLDADPGVSYGLTAGWNGRQKCFSRRAMGHEGAGGLGYSGNELAGEFIMGNTFDYPIGHVKAIAATGKYNVVSCSSEAVTNGSIPLAPYAMVDFIIGQERNDGYSLGHYKSFTPRLQALISAYLDQGGRTLTSGCYLGTDMTTDQEKQFLHDAFGAEYAEYIRTDSDSLVRDEFVSAFGKYITFHHHLNDRHYADLHPESLQPAEGLPASGDGSSTSIMQYTDGGSAAVLYRRKRGRSVVMSFPFECIERESDRREVMQHIVEELTQTP